MAVGGEGGGGGGLQLPGGTPPSPGWGWGSSKGRARAPREPGPRAEWQDRETGRGAGQPSLSLGEPGNPKAHHGAWRQLGLHETELRNTCLSQQRARFGDGTPRTQTPESISWEANGDPCPASQETRPSTLRLTAK